MLIGHSAGAHLAVLAVLELALKRLADTPLSTAVVANQCDAGSAEASMLSQQFTVSQLSAGEVNGSQQSFYQHGLLQSIVGSVFRRNGWLIYHSFLVFQV